MQSRRTPNDAELELYRAAEDAKENAYVPASGFRVGAAILVNNHVVQGANFENDSYGLTICAERGAIGAAVAQGHVADAIRNGAPEHAPGCLEAVAVSGDAFTVSPCGACRQVIAQFANAETRIIYPHQGALVSVAFNDLLPDSFQLVAP